MATTGAFTAIILDSATQAQRDAVHQRVKKATSSWWHSYNDVWIVHSGISINDWIDRLQPVFKTGAGSFLVLGLPQAGETRSWGYFGPNPTQRVGWLHKVYTQDAR